MKTIIKENQIEFVSESPNMFSGMFSSMSDFIRTNQFNGDIEDIRGGFRMNDACEPEYYLSIEIR